MLGILCPKLYMVFMILLFEIQFLLLILGIFVSPIPRIRSLRSSLMFFPCVKYDSKIICEYLVIMLSITNYNLSSHDTLHAFDLLHINIHESLPISSLHGHTWILLMAVKFEIRSLLQFFFIYLKI